MTRALRILASIVLLVVLFAPTSGAQDPAAATATEAVKIKSLAPSISPDKTLIVVETSAPLSLPSSYNLDPLVLVLDIPGADSSALQKQYQVGSPAVDKVNVYQLEEAGQKPITRIEIIMSAVVPYRIYSEDGHLYVDFEHLEKSAGKGKVEEFFKKPEHPQAPPSSTPAAQQERKADTARDATSGEAARIQNIDVRKSGDQLSVVVDYRGKVDYKCFELKAPNRLVLDLINAVNAVPVDTISVKFKPVESIRIAQFQSSEPKIARVVFDLNSESQYSVEPSDNRLTIVFRGGGSSDASGDALHPTIAGTPTTGTPTATSAAAVPPVDEAEVSDIGTTASAGNESTTDHETPPPSSSEASMGQTTEAGMAPSLTVSASEGSEGKAEPTIEAPQAEQPETPSVISNQVELDGTRASGWHGPKGVELAEAPSPIPAGQDQPAEQTVPAEPTPPPLSSPSTRFEAQTITTGEAGFMGEPINLDLVDAPIEQVFRLISEISGLNVITDPGVSGRVTVHFRGVPWDQALDLILKTNGLGYVLENRVVRIAKIDVLTQEEQKKRALRDAKLLSVEPKTITRSLSYARVGDMEPVLTKMLSQRGEIITDVRTNTVIIQDIPDRVDAIDKLIGTLDTATPQVTIQAKIVESSANYTQNLGIQWGFQGIADARHGNQTTLQFPNNILVTGNNVGGTSGIVGPLGGYAVNLPAPAFNSGIGISVGNVLDTFRLDAALTALESSGRGRILSAPKVTTQNNVLASIIQGREIPVQTTANNTTTTTFKNAALELNVTPQITAEGTIIMVVDIKNDQADFGNLVNGIPPIITQKAKTTVLVRDGGTSVIGGIYRAEDSFTQSRTPGLHKIPLLGYLFKNSQKTRTNRELLIFLTPRIVRD